MIPEVILFIVVLLVLFKIFKDKNSNYPPGPVEFPFFGSGIFGFDHQVAKMQKKYGDLFTSKIGGVRVYYLAEYKLIKETFARPEYAGRLPWDAFLYTQREKLTKQCNGVVLSNGSIWQHNRRFMLRHLRDQGMGKSRMGDVIMREVETLVDGFKKVCDKPNEIPFILDLCILNVVWEMVGRHRYSLEEVPAVETFIKTFNTAQEYIVLAGMVNLFPILGILPNFVQDKLFRVNSFLDCLDAFNDHIKPFVDDHKKNLDPENPNDFIDDYLVDMLKEKDNPDSMFTEDDLHRNIFDLFVAGMDTTSRTMVWVILYMAEYQDEQKKCQEILDEVVEKGGLPGLEHRDRLVYIDATLNEVTRMASFTNFNVFHVTTEDSLLNEYTVPKGSMVGALAGLIHKDPRYWEEPLKFNPSRFITDEGKFIQQKEGFLPFGTGRRQCVGESLARMEIFLMSSAILKNFTIKPIDEENVDLQPINVPVLNIPNSNQKLMFSLRE